MTSCNFEVIIFLFLQEQIKKNVVNVTLLSHFSTSIGKYSPRARSLPPQVLSGEQHPKHRPKGPPENNPVRREPDFPTLPEKNDSAMIFLQDFCTVHSYSILYLRNLIAKYLGKKGPKGEEKALRYRISFNYISFLPRL